MVVRDVKQRLREAEGLFVAGDYHGALALLEDLEKVYPGEKKIVYGRAMCLARLNRRAEAMLLCDDMIVRYQDARAQVLKQRIMDLPDTPPTETAPRGSSGRFPHSLRATERVGVGRWLLMILVLSGMGAFLPWLGSMGFGALIDQGTLPVSWGSGAGIFVLFCLMMGGLGLALMWAVLGPLPGDSLGEHARLLAVEVPLGELLACVPVIGWAIWAIRLIRRYEFSVGVALCSILWCVVTGIAAVVVTITAFGAGGLAWLARDFV